jgi:hypothetical protein
MEENPVSISFPTMTRLYIPLISLIEEMNKAIERGVGAANLASLLVSGANGFMHDSIVSIPMQHVHAVFHSFIMTHVYDIDLL